MKVLRTLQRQVADNLVALTYNLDLPFFESALLGPLQAAGCRNVALLCDPSQYQQALRDVPILRHLGQGYVCLPSDAASSAFHPKLILLTGDQGGFMVVGSPNISAAGLTSNLEAVTTFAYSEKDPDEHVRRMFRWAFDYVSRLAREEGKSLFEERLDLLWQTTGWIRRDPAPGTQAAQEASGRWPMHNLDRPLLDQMAERWASVDGTEVEEGVVVSPYFDRTGLALRHLLRRFEPSRLTVVTERGAPGMDPRTFRRVLNESGVPWRTVALASASNETARRLHAKVVALKTRKGTWLLTGSPNLSAPALLRTASEGNAEMALLRHEESPRLMRDFLGPVLAEAEDLELDWDPDLEEGPRATQEGGYRIISAELIGTALTLAVEPALPSDARLRVEFRGREDFAFETGEWVSDGSHVRVTLPEEAVLALSGPASVGLHVLLQGEDLRSARAAVHLPEVLKNRSHPVISEARAKVPTTLVSLRAAQHLDLLELLRNLLVTNAEQLREHRGISALSVRERRLEENLDEEPTYNPEDMIVEERVWAETVPGAAQYVDFEERSLYEHIMSAIRRVVYPAQRIRTDHLGGQEPGKEGLSPSQTGQQQLGGGSPNAALSNEQDANARKKVVAQFSRLAKSFGLGMRDAEYLAQVSAADRKEVFFILTTYLRLLRIDRLVEADDFIRLSDEMFDSLAPATDSTGWPALAEAAEADELEREESETHYWKLAWLHLYLVADLCSKHDPDKLPELAALLRRFGRMVCPPAVLHGLPDDLRKAAWRGTIDPTRATMQARDIVAELDAHCQRYSEHTLIKELRSSVLAQAYVSHESVRGRSVPNLTLVEPWHGDRLDHYWDGFVKFLLWPKPRRSARLVVRDANTLSGDESLEHRLVLFYRGEENQLSVQVAPTDQGIYRGVVKRLPPSELVRLATLSEVIEHENAITFAGTRPRPVTKKQDELRGG